MKLLRAEPANVFTQFWRAKLARRHLLVSASFLVCAPPKHLRSEVLQTFPNIAVVRQMKTLQHLLDFMNPCPHTCPRSLLPRSERKLTFALCVPPKHPARSSGKLKKLRHHKHFQERPRLWLPVPQLLTNIGFFTILPFFGNLASFLGFLGTLTEHQEHFFSAESPRKKLK